MQGKLLKFFVIALGGVLGASLRWVLGNILLANILGCFILGILISIKLNNFWNLLLVFAFCGSLTTFSSWIFSTLTLLIEGDSFNALIDLISHILLGLLFMFFGFILGRNIKRLKPSQ
tara:strand:- start:570 stop:923 length:354 start_codon:yes stop_codon:yes gene_type:complete